MTVVAFTVYGRPQPAGSKTVGFARNGAHFVRDSAKGSAEWKRAVAQVAGDAMDGQPLLEGPLVLTVTFVLPRPKGHFGTGKNAGSVRSSAPEFPTVKPDVTKLLRAVEDAMTGIVWRDDAQVVSQYARKLYGAQTKCEVVVSSAAPRETSALGEGVEPITLAV